MIILLEFNHIPGKDRNVIPRVGQLNIVEKAICKSPGQFPWLRVSRTPGTRTSPSEVQPCRVTARNCGTGISRAMGLRASVRSAKLNPGESEHDCVHQTPPNSL